MPRTIVIADSDSTATGDLAAFFATEPFETVTANSVAAAQAAATRRTPEVVVVGTNFQDAPAFDMARWVLARASRPGLILICSRDDPIDRTIGLELGADDCMSKPVYPRELLARIHSVARRRDHAARPIPRQPVSVQGYTFNLLSRHVSLPSGETAVLSITEAKVLEALIEYRGMPVSRDQLSQRALGREWNPEERALDQHVASLRRKLFVPAPLKPPIHTVRHVGYTIDADSAALTDPA